MPVSLQIAILSRDRPIYLQEAIESALKQEESGVEYEIIISDNSENNEVMELVNSSYIANKKIKYIKRNPTLPDGLNHTELVISELNSKYAVIFHDDDIFHPEYLKKIIPFIVNNSVSAVGTNAFIFKNKTQDCKKKMHDFKDIKKFINKKFFLQQYLLGTGGSAPFSGYIYKTKYLKKLSIKSIIPGKHADVELLASLLDYGSILWLPEVLMFYRVHQSSSSSHENVHDRLKLLRYMYSEGINRNSNPVFLFKYLYWVNWILQQGTFKSNISKWKYRIVLKFLVFSSVKVILSSFFWKAVFKRIKASLFFQ